MNDVARVAGVSVTTVSHVLNGTRRVAPETVEAVMKAITQTGYLRNQVARALATASSTSVGLAMSIITNPYFGGLANRLEDRLRQAGFSLTLANTNDDPMQALDVLNDLRARQVAGVLFTPIEGNPDLHDALADIARTGQPPLVLLDRPADLPLDQVHSDNKRAVFDLVDHLAARGHRRIAYVDGRQDSTSSRDRLAGYRAAVAELGLDPDPSLVISGESSERTAYLATYRFLSEPGRASALVVSNNQMALGSLGALNDLSLSVPDDIAVASFDDFDGAALLQRGLTVMKQDVDSLAAAAVRLLMSRMATPDREPTTIVVPTTFIHRGSCGCMPRSPVTPSDAGSAQS